MTIALRLLDACVGTLVIKGHRIRRWIGGKEYVPCPYSHCDFGLIHALSGTGGRHMTSIPCMVCDGRGFIRKSQLRRPRCLTI